MYNDFYVYVYLNPKVIGPLYYKSISTNFEYSFNFEPFYIGKGRKSRIYDHFYDSKNNTEKYLFLKTLETEFGKTILKEKYIMIYSNNLSNDDAYNLESDLILSIGRIKDNTGPLYNICTDKNPPDVTGIIRPDSYRKMLSNTRRGENNPASKLTNEQAKKIYEDPRPFKDIGDEYGIKYGRVRDIKLGLYYADVTGFQDGSTAAFPEKKYLDTRLITDEEINNIRHMIEIENATYDEVQKQFWYSKDFLLNLKKRNYTRKTYQVKKWY